MLGRARACPATATGRGARGGAASGPGPVGSGSNVPGKAWRTQSPRAGCASSAPATAHRWRPDRRPRAAAPASARHRGPAPRRADPATRCAHGPASRPGPGRRHAPACRPPAPVLHGDGGMRQRHLAQQQHMATPQPSLRRGRIGPEGRRSARRDRDRFRGRRRACSRTWSVRLAMRRRGRPRVAHRVHRPQQFQRTVLGALGGRNAGHRPVAQQGRFRQRTAFQHVQPIGQQRACFVGLVAPRRRLPAPRPACR